MFHIYRNPWYYRVISHICLISVKSNDKQSCLWPRAYTRLKMTFVCNILSKAFQRRRICTPSKYLTSLFMSFGEHVMNNIIFFKSFCIHNEIVIQVMLNNRSLTKTWAVFLLTLHYNGIIKTFMYTLLSIWINLLYLRIHWNENVILTKFSSLTALSGSCHFVCHSVSVHH